MSPLSATGNAAYWTDVIATEYTAGTGPARVSAGSSAICSAKPKRNRLDWVGRVVDGGFRRVLAGPFEAHHGVHGIVNESCGHVGRRVHVWRVKEWKKRCSREHEGGKRTRYDKNTSDWSLNRIVTDAKEKAAATWNNSTSTMIK